MARITLRRLGQELRSRRADRGIREVAKEVGVSAATLSRVERGKLPDLETFAKVCEWLEIDPGDVLGIAVRKSESEDSGPPITAAAHFRADRAISPELAAALAQMILAADIMLQTEPASGDV